MKSKLTLSILILFGFFFQTKTNAQDLTKLVKSRPSVSKYLSAPDSLAIRQQLKTQNLSNKKTLAGQVESYLMSK